MAAYAVEVSRRQRQFCPDDFTTSRIAKVAEWMKKENNPGLLLYGTVGTGKSTMLRSISDILKDVLGLEVARTTAYRLVEDFQDRDSKFRYSDCRRARCLIIDDLGVEPDTCMVWGTEYAPVRELLYDRYDRQAVTIISTNLGEEELLLKYGARIADRLRGTYDRITFKAASYR